jgi:hypothetical protein
VNAYGWPGDDLEVELGPGDVAYVDDGRIVVEHDESGPGWAEEDVMTEKPRPRPIGPRMRTALEYIQTHPGATKRAALEAAGVTCRPYGGGPDTVDRLRMRGLIYNLGRSNHHAWYCWQRAELRNGGRPAGFYAPGHP